MSHASDAEFRSIRESVTGALANGAKSYTRKYRSKYVAAEIADYIEEHYDSKFITYVVTLRNGEAIIVVDMCMDVQCQSS